MSMRRYPINSTPIRRLKAGAVTLLGLCLSLNGALAAFPCDHSLESPRPTESLLLNHIRKQIPDLDTRIKNGEFLTSQEASKLFFTQKELARILALRKKMNYVDKALVILAFPVWGPLLMTGMILTKIDHWHGPIFFFQTRAGQNDQEIVIYKLRTLKKDPNATSADQMVSTKIGVFLRKTKIDEIPQLFSILKGDLNLVGPRTLPFDVRDFGLSDQQHFLLALRRVVPQGVTSLHNSSYVRPGTPADKFAEERLSYDLVEINNTSWSQYLGVLFQTPLAILKGNVRVFDTPPTEEFSQKYPGRFKK